MESMQKFRLSGQLIAGLVVVTLGLLFLLDNLDILDARDILRYWPVLLILLGLPRLVQPHGTPGKLWGLFLVLLGTLLLLDKLYIIYFRLWDLWPLILVFIGASLIWKSMALRTPPRWQHAGDDQSAFSAFAMLGGFRRSSNSQEFRHADVTAIMGGVELDLRRASIKEGEEAVLDVFAFWGGVEVRVPEDWVVSLHGVPILGGFDDKTRPRDPASNKRLIVKGYAIMGGAEIKN